MDVAEIVRLYRPDRVAKTTSEAERNDCRPEDAFHGTGGGVASGEAEVSEEEEPVPSSPLLLPDEPVLGAVVVSGRSEAAGGSAVSVSAGGNGAEVVVESPPGPLS